ncbi:MAG: YfhO family protein [Clostridia bacterium]|nr:YfhO family protein [Clostridia bacterium]
MKKTEIFSGITGFLLTSLILLSAFFAGGMFPFGWGTLSWCDMNQQLIPLFCDFKDILSGEKSLFMNFANAGGMNFYGVFFFFLSSPFTFLVALIDKADMPFFMNVLVILKLSVASFTAAFVIKRLYKNINFGIAAALGSCYSLCGYAMLFYQNIMWLDMMYLFPTVVLGIYKLIKENRPLMLTVTLTLSVIFNFYISFMIFLFVIFFFGIFALIYKKNDRKIYVNLAVSGVLSLVVSAFVWVPCLLQYFSSARGNSFVSGLLNSTFFAPIETTLTVLLCSGILFAALLFAVPRLFKKDLQNKLLCTVLLLTALPLIVEPVNLMWHTGSYMSFPARYGFITVFIGLLIAAKELCETDDVKRRDLTIPLCLFVGVLCTFAILFTDKNVEELSHYTRTLWGSNASLMGQIVICSAFTLCFSGIILLLTRVNLKKGIAVLLLLVTVAAEGYCSADIFMLSAKDKISIYNYQSVIALKDHATMDGFYRVNTSRKITDANMTGAAGFNSISHYTSLNDQTFMETTKKLGYSGYWMETGNWGGSILSDALLSVGYTAKRVNGEYQLIENPYYLGLGIKANGSIPEKLPDGDRLTVLGESFAAMSGEESPVTKYDITEVADCTVKPTENGYCINNIAKVGEITYHLNVGETQTLYFDCYNGFSNRLVEPINESFAVYLNGQSIAERYPTQSLNGLLKLGRFGNTSVDITIKVFKTALCTSFGVFGVNENSVESYTQTAISLNLMTEGGKIKGYANRGDYFISIPYKDNYKITLNGKKLSYTKALGGFVGLYVPQSGNLEITFTPKGFYIGLTFSLLGVVLIIAFYIISKKQSSYSCKLSGIVYGIFLGGFSIAVLLVYIMPIVLNLLGKIN